MNVLIVEDEPQAARRLEKLIHLIMPEAEVLASLDSVASTVDWLNSHAQPDLIFMDIQLADGISFTVFEKVKVASAVIFTTAYEEYALKAFKVNSIDYILKPYDEEELRLALEKFRRLTRPTQNPDWVRQIEATMQILTRRYKERFVIRIGDRLKTLTIEDILFFFSQDKATFAQTAEGRTYIVDFTLDQLEEMIDPARFFRINRKYIVGLNSIEDAVSHPNSRLRLKLKSSNDDDTIVARERVDLFKSWLDH
ncbi:MAG: response regulator transcription factor [Bacteroidetes bacterium]|nr:response regulator transcription factor [Bacteroidota bacterium]